MRSGKHLVVRRTNFEMRHDEPGFTNSQVFMIQAADGTIDDVLIDGCWINGGGFSVQIKDKGKGVPTNVRLTNNRFGRDYQFGILSLSGSIVNTGNVWDDTGEPI